MQTIGEPADNRLEMLDLPIKLCAKACQLFGVTKLDSFDNLIKPGGVRPDMAVRWHCLRKSIRPPGMFGFSRVLLPVSQRLHLIGRDEVGFAGTFAFRHLLRLGRHAIGRSAVALVFLIFLIRLVFVGRLFQLFVLALPIFGQIKVGDKPPGHAANAAWSSMASASSRKSAPALPRSHPAHNSTMRWPLSGTTVPVSCSRSMSRTASAKGACSRCSILAKPRASHSFSSASFKFCENADHAPRARALRLERVPRH